MSIADRAFGIGATGLLVAGAVGFTGLTSPAMAATSCTPTGDFTDCQRFTYTGSDQTLDLPAGVTAVEAHVWGAGGGGAPGDYTPAQLTAGGGGYAMGTIPTSGGETLTVVVGQGGVVNSTAATYGGGGGGGAGATAQHTGASGGGASGVFLGAASAANAQVMAGGGGGGAPGTPTIASGKETDNFGGGGGDAHFGGDAAFDTRWNGLGGQLTQGGDAASQAGCDTEPTAGQQLMGGAGGTSTTFEGGGGGGGGYWGGGGGRCQNADEPDDTNIQNGGGGGGGGFLASAVTGGTSERGKNPSVDGVGGDAGGMSDPFYTAGVGLGGGLTASTTTSKLAAKSKPSKAKRTEDATPGNGMDGEVVLLWKTPESPTPPADLLAVTGAKTGQLAATGAGLLFIGAVLAIGTRRRYTR